MREILKSIVFRGVQAFGANALLLRSNWRRNRLLILCYHGTSLEDEHRWSGLYLSADTFRGRLERLRRARANVLPLDTAVEMLRSGTLPPRAVVITFDDGFYDFRAKAWPLLQEFGYAATVYLTSYYAEYNMPVFDLMCSYLLWKARGRRFRWPEMGIEPVVLEEASASSTAERIKANCRRLRMEGPAHTEVLREMAGRLDLDFADLHRRRVLHIMTPEEVSELVRQGVDFQLHGHWHRVSRSRERFHREIEANRAAMAQWGISTPAHYCYPAGFRLPEFSEWLADLDVRSAVTCEMRMAAPNSDVYALPRLLDTPGLSADEFSAWISGIASWIPRPEYRADPNQLLGVDEELPMGSAVAGCG